jgi:hypothetical protein
MKPAIAFVAAVACAASASPVSADTEEPLLTQTIAVNPVFPLYGTLSVEYEHALGGTPVTVGVSGWYEFEDVKARWVYGKAMYYLRGTPLRGPALGITGGVLRAYAAADDAGGAPRPLVPPDDADAMGYDTTPTVGAMVQYNGIIRDWLVVGLGIGGRVAVIDIADDSPLHRLDGDVRLVLGHAF